MEATVNMSIFKFWRFVVPWIGQVTVQFDVLVEKYQCSECGEWMGYKPTICRVHSQGYHITEMPR